jgi:membrane associated rhomboid family serine protease
LMLICTAVFCLQALLPWQMTTWLALHGPLSGRFMPWQPITYAFMHADFLHLFFNMLALWMFGAELEMLWGRRRYLQFLAACVATAAGAQMLLTTLLGSGAPTVGASGGVFGLMLAVAMLFPHRDYTLIIPPVTLNVRVMVAIYGALELYLGVRGETGVAHFAHLGGMVGGFLMIRYWRGQWPFGRGRRRF